MKKLEFVAIQIPYLKQTYPALHTLDGRYMPLTTGFEIHRANEYLRTMTSQNVEFISFVQYQDLIRSISAEISK